MQDNDLNPPMYEDASPPEYRMEEDLGHPGSTDVAEKPKSHLLPESPSGKYHARAYLPSKFLHSHCC